MTVIMLLKEENFVTNQTREESNIFQASLSNKLLMVRTLREMGEVFAMTSDGTNDAPTILEADANLARCIQGVVEDSSNIVIMDNNFVSFFNFVQRG